MPIKPEETEVLLPETIPKTAYELEIERKAAIAKFTDLHRALSWPVDRAPTVERCFASKYLGGKSKKKGKIVLPKNFHSELGDDTKIVWANEDLHRVVYNWYSEVVQKDHASTNHPKWINYVTNDEVQSRRHEYLGPAPRVAGYQLGHDGNIHIRFWDAFLQDAWVENGEWELDVVQDSRGNWVEA